MRTQLRLSEFRSIVGWATRQACSGLQAVLACRKAAGTAGKCDYICKQQHVGRCSGLYTAHRNAEKLYRESAGFTSVSPCRWYRPCISTCYRLLCLIELWHRHSVVANTVYWLKLILTHHVTLTFDLLVAKTESWHDPAKVGLILLLGCKCRQTAINLRIKQMPPRIIHILHFFVVDSLPQIL